MALIDLLDKIESFDYNQVGQPQSFEANGGVVTGQQTFNRPLEEPLPISEALGFGLRTSEQNFFDDTYATGFTKKIDSNPVDGSDFIQDYNPSLSFGDTTFQFGDSVNFFSDIRVKGFTQNTSPENIGPGSTDFKFISGDTYTVKPEIKDTVYKWPSFNSPLEVNFFSDTHVVGFSKEMQTSTQFHVPPVSSKMLVNSIGGGQYNSTSYLWSTDYFDKLNNLEFLDISGVGTDSITFQSKDTLSDINFEGQGGEQFRRQTARIENFQSPSSFSPITARFASNFLVDADPEKDPVLQTDIMQGSIEQLNVDTQGGTINIGPGRGGIRYDSSYTGRKVQRDGQTWKWGVLGVFGMGFFSDKDVALVPNELEDFAKEYMVDEGRIMMLDVDGDGKPIIGRSSGQILSDKKGGIEGIENTYTDYIQAMSPGKSQPFIVRKIGDDWGLGGDNEGFFEAIGDFAGELAGGFIRTTGSPFDSFTGRLGRELADVVRKGKYLLTSDGLTFGIQQFLLQASNRTIETRTWNPLSLASNNFVAFTRHMKGIDVLNDGGNYEEAIDGFGVIKSVLPGPISGLVDTLGIGKADEHIGKGRIVNQVLWTKGNDLAVGGDTFKNIQIRFHNVNHAFRLTKYLGPLDPYKGPDGEYDVGTGKGAEALRKNLEKGGQRTDYSYTFLKDPENAPSQLVKKVGNKKQPSYKFKTYGQIPSDDILEAGYYEGDMISPRPSNTKKIKMPTSPIDQNFLGTTNNDLTTRGFKDMVKQVRETQGQSYEGATDDFTIDRVNARPLSSAHSDTEALDFITFKFTTLAYEDNVAYQKTLQFRATVAAINESITPEYQEQRYLGRPEKYYTYSGVDRDVSLEFTLYPKTAAEFPFLAEKLNYLVGLTYPQYTNQNYMIAPYTKLTLGDMFREQPGYISSLTVNVQDNTTWEIDMFEFPKHITANMTYRLIGKHRPHTFGKHYDIPWLQTNEKGHTLNLGQQDPSGETPPKILTNRAPQGSNPYIQQGDLGDMVNAMDLYQKAEGN